MSDLGRVDGDDKGNLGELEVSDLLPEEAGGIDGELNPGSTFVLWHFRLFYDPPPNSELSP